MPRKDCLIGLDVGTSRISAIAGVPRPDGSLDVVGIGHAESAGIRRGFVASSADAIESIRHALLETELTAGTRIDAVHLAISGAHAEGINSRGVVAIGGNGIVSDEDVRRATEAASAVHLPAGREILHVIPQRFTVDEQDAVRDPIGLTGVTLDASVHIVTGLSSNTRNLVACAEQAGVKVIDTVAAPIAAADAVLTPDERDLGVALVGAGAGTTTLAIFDEGTLWHTAVVGPGGEHLTRDVAIGLCTPVRDAESLKCRSGAALTTLVGQEETIEAPSLGTRPPRLLPRRLLAEILQSRLTEIFDAVRRVIRAHGWHERLTAGVVLTGGGALLAGVEDLAELALMLPVRVGAPRGLGGLDDQVDNPVFAAAAGAALRAHRRQAIGPRRARSRGLISFLGL